MYVPKQFQMQDRAQILAFVEEYSFGLIVSLQDGLPVATHIPLLVEEKEDGALVLRGHIAKANSQWQQLANQQVLAIFSGPHAFISNLWYEQPNTVSTWNYIAVHMRGTARLIEEPQQLWQLLEQTERKYGGDFAQSEEAHIQGMMQAIVGFEVDVTAIDAQWKLNQHHPSERREKVITQLARQQDDNSQQIARWMKK